MKVSKITVGKRFGQLLVVEDNGDFIFEPNGHKRRVVVVKCDCGKESSMRTAYINRGATCCMMCSRNNRTMVKIGEIYDDLTIIGFTNIKNKKQAICRCICGNIVNRRSELLFRINMTNNCGCKHRGQWKGVGELSSSQFNRYKQGAIKRNLKFDITIEYAWDIFQQQNNTCALSGLKIGFPFHTTAPYEASLDRIDSNQGYIKGNVQWVHKDIQKMKMDLPQDRFIELCKLIASKN
jgi:hypothetical protein